MDPECSCRTYVDASSTQIIHSATPIPNFPPPSTRNHTIERSLEALAVSVTSKNSSKLLDALRFPSHQFSS